MGSLGKVLSDPSKTIVFHAGSNDIPYLRRELACRFSNIFDTHIAAKILGLSGKGLAYLIHEFFNIKLDKRYQRADWRIRPLPEDQAEYARMDTRYLIPLRNILRKQLIEKELWQDAQAEFSRICNVSSKPKEFVPTGWAKLKGAREIPPERRSILQELYVWRENLARGKNTAVFRVLPDHIIVSIAKRFPRNRTALLKQFHHPTVKRYADEIMACLERGKLQGKIPLPPITSRTPPLSANQQKAYHALRQHRNKISQSQQLEPDLVISNRLLKRIVIQNPENTAELESIEGLTPWKAKRHASWILDILRRTRTEPELPPA